MKGEIGQKATERLKKRYRIANLDGYEEHLEVYILGYKDGLADSGLVKEKPKKESKTPPNWRNDFDIYKDMLSKAFADTINNKEWLKRKSEEYPRVDIVKTLRKACMDYWATNDGWKNKKARRGDIDWLRTFNNSLDNKLNWVFKDNTTYQKIEETKKLNNLRGAL